MTEDNDITYGNYLRVPELLDLQHPLSEPQHPDELQFIIIHQAFELWFKLILFEMERAIAAMSDDNPPLATHVMRRITSIQGLLAHQISILSSMTPRDFHGFRGYLGTASGLQSYQFREMEVLSGLRDDEYQAFLKRNYVGDIWRNIERRYDQTPLNLAWADLLARRGIADLLDLYLEPSADHDIYQLAEELFKYDELMIRWRYLHIQLVERIIGGKSIGTGGGSMSDMEATLKIRFFPALGEVRTRLTEHFNQLAE